MLSEGMDDVERTVLQAVADNDIGFVWHGSQLRLHWWTGEYDKRRLTRAERTITLAALNDGLAEKQHNPSRFGRGALALTAAGRERLGGLNVE